MNKFLLVICVALTCVCAKDTYFFYDDWEVACDNTHTCRMAGYSEDGSDYPVSMLFTLRAGMGQKVAGEAKLGTYDDTLERLCAKDKKCQFDLIVNGQKCGTFSGYHFLFNDSQIAIILKALTKKSEIYFAYHGKKWILSDKGASASMLKIDDYQKRVGTISALIRKGSNDESSVLKSTSTPVVYAQNVYEKEMKLSDKAKSEIIRELNLEKSTSITAYKLNEKKMVVSYDAWSSAYNFGRAFYLMNIIKPFESKLVTENGSDYVVDTHKGVITERTKGRGLGDCWYMADWVWDGKNFAPTYKGTTGMCRLIEAGGAWDLPNFITQVKFSDQ